MIVLDFEASALVDGYPISVGVAASDGRLFYRVIKPHDEWHAMRWDPVSERIHGLSKENLEEQGVPPSQVMAELNAMFSGEVLVSDNPPFEWRWLQLLVEYGGKAEFSLSQIEAGAILTASAAKAGISSPELAEIERRIGRMARHHALLDAAAWVAGLEAATGLRSEDTKPSLGTTFEKWRVRIERAIAGRRHR